MTECALHSGSLTSPAVCLYFKIMTHIAGIKNKGDITKPNWCVSALLAVRGVSPWASRLRALFQQPKIISVMHCDLFSLSKQKQINILQGERCMDGGGRWNLSSERGSLPLTSQMFVSPHPAGLRGICLSVNQRPSSQTTESTELHLRKVCITGWLWKAPRCCMHSYFAFGRKLITFLFSPWKRLPNHQGFTSLSKDAAIKPEITSKMMDVS